MKKKNVLFTALFGAVLSGVGFFLFRNRKKIIGIGHIELDYTENIYA